MSEKYTAETHGFFRAETGAPGPFAGPTDRDVRDPSARVLESLTDDFNAVGQIARELKALLKARIRKS